MKSCIFALAVLCIPASQTFSADLVITPANPDLITIHVISDTHCPGVCTDLAPRCPEPPCPDSIPCCDTFLSIVHQMNSRPPDLTLHCGDLILNSEGEPHASHFLGYWNSIAGERHFVMGNHEADPGAPSSWLDPENHYAPANWLEPLFGCDSLTAISLCRRWYSIYLGEPPRAAILVVSNNSDELYGDPCWYRYCGVPNDSLNHAGSTQRRWLDAEIDALPPTVRAVFALGHRTYYGVEGLQTRANIEYSGVGGDHEEAPAETLRTGAVSFLRDLESIYDRKVHVAVVAVLNGDQHCFAEVRGLRRNALHATHGVRYVTVGISGGRIDRNEAYPDLSKIPRGSLVHAFDDRWGYSRFEISVHGVAFSVREAYSDTLLHQSFWPFNPTTAGAQEAGTASNAPGSRLEAWPNPASGVMAIRFAPPAEFSNARVSEFAVYDVKGRLIRNLVQGRWISDVYSRDWDLRDAHGDPVPAGVYFVRVACADRMDVAKLVVTR
jgi:hypothetical protein